MPAESIYWLIQKAALGEGGLDLAPTIWLSEQELERFQQLARYPKRQQEWLAGRVAVKQLLAVVDPTMAPPDPKAVQVLNLASGAPYVVLKGTPLAGFLSLSHRAECSLCAWSAATPLGIDLEWIEERSPAFIQDYLTPAEQSAVQGCALEKRAGLVNCLWSAKEAVLKALGVGLRLDTRRVELTPRNLLAEGEWNCWPARVTDSEHASAWDVWVQKRQGYVLTLALSSGTIPNLIEISGG